MVGMYSGNLINDLCATVERVQASIGAASRKEAQSNLPSPNPRWDSCSRSGGSESEQLPQTFGLRAADGNLGLLLVVHTQLVRTLEPGHDLADAIDIDQVGAVRPPE